MIKEILFKTHMLILLENCIFYKTILCVEQKFIHSVAFQALKWYGWRNKRDCGQDVPAAKRRGLRPTGKPADAAAKSRFRKEVRS